MRILWKQLLVHLGTLIISFVLLALVLTQGIRGFLTEQKVAELMTLAQRVAHSMENFAMYGGIFNLHALETEIRNVHQYTDASVMIINHGFEVWVGYGFGEVVAALPNVTELAPLMDGEVVAVVGATDNPAFAPLVVVGYPFWFGGDVAGAALVGFSMAELEAAIAGMYRITLIALAGTAVFAIILIYISSQAISRPLRQMNEAASVIAGGDFEKRLPIRSKDEVGQLATEFNRMAESLQEQERIRREFIANLSHDMRSPLTSMRGFLTALSDGTIPPEQQPHYLNIIMDESERLIKLSNNILDIHRIQDAEMGLVKTEFDVNELIRHTILGFQQRALEKRIMIASHFAHPQDMVLADEDKVRRVMYNLLDNAIKFTPEGGEITVETTVKAATGKVTIAVADTGQGMTEEEQKRVFDRFYKGDPSRNVDKMGSGLGLSIVKEFVRAHGETVQLTSEPGKGSVFTFALELV
jgi:signal transduction histidine kinase